MISFKSGKKLKLTISYKNKYIRKKWLNFLSKQARHPVKYKFCSHPRSRGAPPSQFPREQGLCWKMYIQMHRNTRNSPRFVSMLRSHYVLTRFQHTALILIHSHCHKKIKFKVDSDIETATHAYTVRATKIQNEKQPTVKNAPSSPGKQTGIVKVLNARWKF